MKTKLGLFFFLFFCFWNTIFGQKQDKFGYYLRLRKVARIPFELHSNLIIVPVKINNSDTLRFILDTGVSTTIVTDPSILQKQTLRYARTVKLSGVGEGQELEADVAIGNTVSMGAMTATYQNIVVLKQDMLHLSEFIGLPVHGIFGYDIFNNFVVTIDFENRELFLTSPHNYTYRPNKGNKYPLIIEETKPYTEIVSLVQNGKELPIKVLIDTGAGHALWLNPSKNEQIRPPKKVIRAQLGRGLSGIINGSMGRVGKIKLGHYELDNVLASYPDSISFGVKLPTRSERQGNIGCEILRRFRVTFNYQEQYVVLKPIKNKLKEAFEHDMSGLELRARPDNLHQYYVENVVENSPAWKAGIQEGDELLFFNNNPASEMSISELYKALQKGEGQEVTLLVRRNGNVEYVSFKLKRMI